MMHAIDREALHHVAGELAACEAEAEAVMYAFLGDAGIELASHLGRLQGRIENARSALRVVIRTSEAA